MASETQAASAHHELSNEDLIAILRTMLTHRMLEARGFQLNRQGKIPFASAGEGHEAVQAGAAMAFERGKDVLVPYYRDVGLCLGIGLTTQEVMNTLFAREAGHSSGRQFPHHYASRALGIQTISSVIGAQLPHAVGAAYALKLRKQSGRAVLVTFGEGATSEGEWHESLNFAAVHQLPIVFLCENNEWAISTPISLQMAQPDIAHRLIAAGILTAEQAADLKQSILAEANEATDRAEAMPYAAPSSLRDQVYADTWEPWR